MKVGKWRCCPVLIDETNGNIPPRPDLPKASSGNLMSERTNRPRAPGADDQHRGDEGLDLGLKAEGRLPGRGD